MSRRHPTHKELEQKAKNIEEERNKVSTFRPKITRDNPNDIWTPGKVERDDRGLIIGETKPIFRYGQTPFNVVRKAAKWRHDRSSPCSREDCAFKNTSTEAEKTAEAVADVITDLRNTPPPEDRNL